MLQHCQDNIIAQINSKHKEKSFFFRNSDCIACQVLGMHLIDMVGDKSWEVNIYDLG